MLRNAFDELGSESTLGRILETLRTILRQQTYARTPQDAMRVNVENGISAVTSSVFQGNSNTAHMQGAGNAPGLWANNSWNAIDARFPYGEQLNANFINSTRGRWTIT